MYRNGGYRQSERMDMARHTGAVRFVADASTFLGLTIRLVTTWPKPTPPAIPANLSYLALPAPDISYASPPSARLLVN